MKLRIDPIVHNPKFQSPYTYIQAAGADGTDSTGRGIHLRWAFQKALGDLHLAKGNLTPASTLGFNRANDFVKVFRAAYNPAKAVVKIKISNATPDLPTTEVNTGATREWKYLNKTSSTVATNKTDVTIKFTNVAEYDTIRAGMTSLKPKDFMKQYKGVIEVYASKLMFAVEMDSEIVSATAPAGTPTYIRVESVALSDTEDASSKYISCRKAFAVGGSSPSGKIKKVKPGGKPSEDHSKKNIRIECENIEHVRLDGSNAFVKEFRIETYVDFIVMTNASPAGDETTGGDWTFIGDFALTDSNSVAATRFEPPGFIVNGVWPKYNEPDSGGPGTFRVKGPNYADRWLSPADPSSGLKNAVQQYLSLSVTDLKANAVLPSDESGDHAEITVSYLDMIKLAGLDYHAARMLGLGHMDNNPGNDDKDFIYALQYVTTANLSTGAPGTSTVTHTYLTLPTSRKDFRLPPAPTLIPVSYGLYADNGTATPTLLTDTEGYSLYDDTRFVNLNRGQFFHELPFGPFFYNLTEYCLCDQTLPVLFGIDYRKQGEINFRKPEISNDPTYTDASGIYPETVPIPDTGENPVFIHRETEEGIHEYGMYSINWFSRISTLSNLQPTNNTDFPKRTTLLPPFNLGVQLIQDESPLIFTTSAEQTLLQSYTAADKTLVRTTFDWNHIHFNAHQYATHAELFFRDEMAREVKGEIVSVVPTTNHRVIVTTNAYTITSTSPAQIVQPLIAAADSSRFAGSTFSAGEVNYVVDSILSAGVNPTFILKQVLETNNMDPTTGGGILVTETYLSPAAGDRFFVSENLANENNWDAHLAKKIYLEKFSTNATVDVVGSGVGNDKTYTIYKIAAVGANTEITVVQPVVSSLAAGNLVFKKTKRITAISGGTTLVVQGIIPAAELPSGTDITISASLNNNGVYSVSGLSTSGGNTLVTISPAPPDTVNFSGYMSYSKSYPVTGASISGKKFTVAGNIVAEVDAPYMEYVTEFDGSITRTVPGGIYKSATIVEKPRVYSEGDPEIGDPPYAGDVVPSSLSGVFEITFPGYQLPSHIDPEVDWYKGTVRVLENAAFTGGAVPQMKVLQVWNVDRSGPDLKLLVVDNTFNYVRTGGVDVPAGDYIPIATGTVNVNFHPSYKHYLKADNNTNATTGGTNNFDAPTILPALGEGNRKTLMAIRSVDDSDTTEIIESYMHVPVVLLAQEIAEPLPIGPPAGPLYATRPDYYGKSTYTFDVKVDTTGGRQPFALVFYRTNEDRILDVLYSPATVQQIKSDLAALMPDAYFTDRWNDLINGNYNSSTGEFNTYGTGIYKFPLPDNTEYIIPNRNRTIIERPFASVHLLNSNYTYSSDGSITRPFIDIVKEALLLTFFPLTEQPLMYKYIKNETSTSNRKPVYKLANGNLMSPADAAFDPSPMAVKYVNSGDTFVRFTDYSLDGASKNVYFYYGIELSNKMQFGPIGANGIAGPIQLINVNPAGSPEIKRVLTRLQSAVEETTTAVLFELNNYIPGENIKKLQVYRTTDANDALSMRNMTLAKDINVGDTVLDDFSDVDFPLYGDPLFYRIVALREIVNEFNATEYVPSQPSNLVLASIVDVVNPPAPKLKSLNGITTATELQNVILKWEPTCYNGTYSLQKQNASGNWVEIYKVKSNAATIQYPPLDGGGLPDFATYPETAVLPRLDEDGNSIYHRFRVRVENSSGLLNLSEKELTLAKGVTDLQEMDVVSYTDSNHTINPLLTQEVDEGVSHPLSMTFTDIASPLPAGHNTFVKTDVTVTDDLNNTATKTINTIGGAVTFNHGDGTGLLLDSTNPNRVYTIITKTYTDFASSGAGKKYVLNYVSGPCHDLLQLNDTLISLTDSTHTISPFTGTNIDEGVAYPGFLTIKDVSNLVPLGQVFDHMDVKLTDDLGNTFTKTITIAAGSVTFNHGDGGLVLNNSNPNRTYTIEATLVTDLCAGTTFGYDVSYTFSPCNQLTTLTSLAGLMDGNSFAINPIVNSNVTAFTHPNGTMAFGEIVSSVLPSGHTFASMDIILEDDLGGSFLKTISAASGSVVFNHGDGGLVLDGTNPNRTYIVTIVLYTNLCTDGTVFAYQVKYGV